MPDNILTYVWLTTRTHPLSRRKQPSTQPTQLHPPTRRPLTARPAPAAAATARTKHQPKLPQHLYVLNPLSILSRKFGLTTRHPHQKSRRPNLPPPPPLQPPQPQPSPPPKRRRRESKKTKRPRRPLLPPLLDQRRRCVVKLLVCPATCLWR